MFWLKKFVSFWLMPLPFCLTLLVVGVCLLRTKTRAKFGRMLVTAATVLLLVFSNRFISTALVQPLETIYPAIPELTDGQSVPAALAECRYIVVLGGGHGDGSGFSAVNKLSASSLRRVTEGVRLTQRLPAAKLITSGRGAPGFPSHASVARDAAVSLGIDSERIIILETPRDTEEEAQEIRRVVGDAPFALVTSAWHMRRASALARKAGLKPLECPADYSARHNADFSLTDLGWDTESLGRSTWAVYEQLGYLWSRLRRRA